MIPTIEYHQHLDDDNHPHEIGYEIHERRLDGRTYTSGVVWIRRELVEGNPLAPVLVDTLLRPCLKRLNPRP